MQQLGKKLQLKKEQRILLLNAPAPVMQMLMEEGYSATTEARAGEKFDAVQLFVHGTAELNNLLERAVGCLGEGSAFWIAYPKKSSGVVSDLTRDEGWKPVFEKGFSGVRQIAVDEVWSSLRFKHMSERTAPSKMGAEYAGIDKSTRTVIPPADLQAALDEAGLSDKFQELSFTCKKEYVIAVLDAKRVETRKSRISKTIEQVASK